MCMATPRLQPVSNGTEYEMRLPPCHNPANHPFGRTLSTCNAKLSASKQFTEISVTSFPRNADDWIILFPTIGVTI